MASKGNNCSLSIPLSARPDTTTQTNLWPRPFRIAVRALRALAPSVISSPATGSLSLCIFLYFLLSLSLFSYYLAVIIIIFTSSTLFLPRREEDWGDRGGAVLLLLFLFFDRSMLFSWLGPKRRRLDSSEGKPSIIIIIIIFTFLGPGQREEDWTGRGRTGKPSIIVINIIIFTFHAFLDSGQREEEVDRSGESTTQQYSLLGYWEVRSITVWNHYVDRGWIPDSSWIVILKMWMKEILSSLHSLINSISIPWIFNFFSLSNPMQKKKIRKKEKKMLKNYSRPTPIHQCPFPALR